MENKENAKFSMKQRIKSFGYALNGLKILICEEHNSRIHFSITLVVVAMGFTFDISAFEWIAICLGIGLVFGAEILNSAIENLSDYVAPEKHKLIKKTKDLSAAAVLVCSIMSVIIGVIIFLPKLITIFR